MAGAFLLFILLTSPRGSASDPGAAAVDHPGPASGALTVSVSETPDAVRLHIQASGDVKPGSVEVRFAGRKTVVLARDAEGRPIRSQPLRLPEPVVEEGSSADYDADGALVMTLRKQATAQGAGPTGRPGSGSPLTRVCRSETIIDSAGGYDAVDAPPATAQADRKVPARVQLETASWLIESRGSLGAAQSRFNDISSMDVTGAGALFMSAEYAVKAVIVEHYGFLPPSFETHHRIVNLSHLIGLWWQLPPDLRAYLADLAPLDPNVLYPRETLPPRDPPRTYETLVSSSSNAEWQQRLTTAPRFIQYIERDVIGNSAAFDKLTF